MLVFLADSSVLAILTDSVVDLSGGFLAVGPFVSSFLLALLADSLVLAFLADSLLLALLGDSSLLALLVDSYVFISG